MNAKILPIVAVLAVLIPAQAFAQTPSDQPFDIEIKFTVAEGVVISLGVFAGLTTAYLRMRAARNKAVEEGKEWSFDATRFIDRVVMAVIASVPLAIASAMDMVVLNSFNMVLIFLASLGSSELILELREKNATKKK